MRLFYQPRCLPSGTATGPLLRCNRGSREAGGKMSKNRTSRSTSARKSLSHARPAIPIDIAAFSYHWSALKIARLIFFFSGLACGSDFLALVDLGGLFFDIFPPASLEPLLHLSRGPVAVPEGRQRGR